MECNGKIIEGVITHIYCTESGQFRITALLCNLGRFQSYYLGKFARYFHHQNIGNVAWLFHPYRIGDYIPIIVSGKIWI